MTSILGFVAKDNGLSNASMSQSIASPIVSTPTLAVTNLSVSNLTVAQTFTTTDATTTTNFLTMTITSQLLFTGNNMSNEIFFTDLNGTLNLNVQPRTRGIVYTIPDVGVNVSFILSEGTQTIDGMQTFTSPLTYLGSNISDEIVFSDTATGGTLTLNVQPVKKLTYTIADTGVNSSFILTNGDQTINGLVTFTATPVFPTQGFTSIVLVNTSNQITFDTGQTITLSAPTPAASVTYTIPDEGSNATFVLTPSAFPITIASASDQLILGQGNTITISAPTPAASRSCGIPDTKTNSNFVMTDGSQTISGFTGFTGANTFTSTTRFTQIGFSYSSSQIVFGGGSNQIIVVNATPSLEHVYTIPDEGADAAFVLTPSAFPITIAPNASANNQLVLAGVSSRTIALNAPSPSASRSYTVPDSGANSRFILSDSAQTLTGQITLANSILLATPGGVPTSLNYYEEYASGTLTFVCGVLVGGSTTVGYSIVKIGKNVNFSLAAFSGFAFESGSPDFFTASGNPLIPTRFYAAQSVNQTIDVQFGGNNTALGTFNMSLSGSTLSMVISQSAIAGSIVELQIPFTATGTAIGWQPIRLSWITST